MTLTTQPQHDSAETVIRVRRSPVVVVGSGVAGLSAALAHGSARLITDGRLGLTGSSPWAQGGIAAAIDADDSTALHAIDTVAAGAGVNDVDAVAAVIDRGPEAIARAIGHGTRFDRTPEGDLALGREAAHSRHRIVHADGDATGAEVMRALTAATIRSDVDVVENTAMLDLITATDGSVVGALTRGPHGELIAELAPAVILATGGYAHCFARTTTPAEVLGGGIAAAARAGAEVADMEFVQFHPTALDIDGTGPLPLLTEALRGAGAVVVDENGRRFLTNAHDDAEMAPRDIVARGVYRHTQAGHRVFLDTRDAIGADIAERFPTVFSLCQQHGFDPRSEPIPITPAAHYCMGGVSTDPLGRTATPGLWAVGEAATSGLHGANRLASNSLLDGMVVGHAVGAALADRPDGNEHALASVAVASVEIPVGHELPTAGSTETGTERLEELRLLMWSYAGVERSGADIETARRRLDERDAPRTQSERSVLTIAQLVLDAALLRRESRGAHFRTDHPLTDGDATRRTGRVRDVERCKFAIDTDRLVPALDAVASPMQ